MIAHLDGEILAKGSNFAILGVGGIGYEVMMPTSALAELPVQGSRAQVWTKLIVREEEMQLYGFTSHEDKELFEKLMTVSGVGPKVALATLSTFTPQVLANAVESDDVSLVTSIPGVGKKGAQRIILELKGKLGGIVEEGTSSGNAPAPGDEVTDALLSMGFSPAEVSTALEGFDGSAGDTAGAIKYALKRLGANR